MRIPFKIKLNVGDFNKGLESFHEGVRDAVTEVMKKNFDSGFSYSWLEDGGMLHSPEMNKELLLKRPYGSGDSAATEILSKMYVEAWDRRYEELQDWFKKNTSQEWVDWKKKNEGEPTPKRWDSPHVIGQFESSDWAIMTGFLKSSVTQMFKQGEAMGQGPNQFANPMIGGYWYHDVDSYGYGYLRNITEWLVEQSGALDDKYSITDIDMTRIANAMMGFLRGSFVQPFMQKMKMLDITIDSSG